MIRTLEELSGVTHKSYIDQKTVTKDNEKLFLANEGKTGYTMTTKEVPVITKNDMLFISDAPGPSMVFRAGSAPIWNRGQMTLPMSWKLIKENPICVPGKTYNLQTIPSTSSVLDFDVKNNQPDVIQLLEEEIKLAMEVVHVKQVYMEKTGLSEVDIERLDKDVYSQDIMRMLHQREQGRKQAQANAEAELAEGYVEEEAYDESMYQVNEETVDSIEEKMAEKQDMDRKRFAKGLLSKSQILCADGELKRILMKVFADKTAYFEKDRQHFAVKNKSLWSMDERVEYIHYDMSKYEALQNMSRDEKKRVYDGTPRRRRRNTSREEELFGAYTVTEDYLEFLAETDDWSVLAGGYLEDMVANMVAASESM